MALYFPVSTGSDVGDSFLSSVIGGATAGIPRMPNFGGGLSGIGGAVGRMASDRINREVTKLENRVYNAIDKQTRKLGLGGFSELLGKIDTFGLSAINSTDGIQMAGGLTWQDLRDVFAETMGYDASSHLSKKNMYFLEVGDSPFAGRFSKFHLFAHQLSFSPISIVGETTPIGSAEIDKISVGGRTEMSLTTLDDRDGTIKNWAREKALVMTPSDGTVGIPADYIFYVRVIFGTNLDDYASGNFDMEWAMRLADMGIELGRDADELEQVTLKFVQTDTCYNPTLLHGNGAI